MKLPLNPPTVRPPFGRYSHGIAVPEGARLVFCSGQLGVRVGDTLPTTVEGQAEICFRNIEAILAEAGMTMADIVRINAFVTRREDMKNYMLVRDRFVSDPPPASTLIVVAGFTREEFLVEVEATAAKVD